MKWSFYDSATGVFTTATYSGPVEHLPAATPYGCSPIEDAGIDHLSQRVDVTATPPVVVDYQPPQPSADHAWDPAAKRWVMTPAAADKLAKHARALALITQLEAAQHRAVREAALNLPGAAARLQVIDDQIAVLRKDLT